MHPSQYHQWHTQDFQPPFQQGTSSQFSVTNFEKHASLPRSETHDRKVSHNSLRPTRAMYGNMPGPEYDGSRGSHTAPRAYQDVKHNTNSLYEYYTDRQEQAPNTTGLFS